jgi:hypothetical protein
MFGLLSALAFVISFVLYAASVGKAPWDYVGVAIIGLALLAVHVTWDIYPWRRPPA